MIIEIKDIPLGHKIDRINIEFSHDVDVDVDVKTHQTPPSPPTPPPVRIITENGVAPKVSREVKNIPPEMQDSQF